MLKKQLFWLLLMPFYLWGATLTTEECNEKDVILTENITLEEDVVCGKNVTIKGAVLNLNYHTITVNGDLNITDAYARLQMTKSSDKLIVKGDLTFAGASSYQDLTNGVIELAGNFYQKGTETEYNYRSTKDGTNYNQRYRSNNAFSFYPTENHKIILNGNSQQIVDFQSPNNSRFNNLEIQNSSSAGVFFEQLSIVGVWKRNGNHVTISDIRNLTLTENYTIPNDVELIGGVLNLNGFILTINGNLKFSNSYCRLQMKKDDDKLIVKGDLTFAGASSYQDLTNGIIELAGNFYQKGTETEYNYRSTKDGTNYNQRYRSNNAFSFYPTENHKLILNGDSLQRVSFEAPNSSRFMNLEITNSDVTFDLDAGQKVTIVDGLYVNSNLYNSIYKGHEDITYGRYRDIDITYMPLNKGLYLTALPIKTSLNQTQIQSVFSNLNVDYVLKYNSSLKKWQGFSSKEAILKKMQNSRVSDLTTINAGEGLFISINKDTELKFPRAEGYKTFDKVDIQNLGLGWHLLGSNREIKIDNLMAKNSNIKVVWFYKNGKWSYYSDDSDIKAEYHRRDIPLSEDSNGTNIGFWLYVE